MLSSDETCEESRQERRWRFPRYKHGYALFFFGLCLYSVFSIRENLEGRGVAMLQHGWPIAALGRQIPGDKPQLRYVLWTGVYECDSLGIVKNVLFSSVFGLFVICSWHFSSSGKRISLMQLLVVTTVTCVMLAGYAFWLKTRGSQEKVLAKMEEAGWRTGFANDLFPWYVEPLRDLRLMQHDDGAYFSVEWEPSDDSDKLNVQELNSYKTKLTLVRSVSIFEANLDDQGLQVLGKWIPNLTNLDLGGCPDVTDNGALSIVSMFPRLRDLTLDGARVTNKGAETWANLNKLEEFWVENPIADSAKLDLSLFMKSRNLRTIAIPRQWIDSAESIDALARKGIDVVTTPQGQLNSIRDW